MSEMSWESRVEALEKSNTELAAKVAERDATIASLKALADESKAREQARRKAEVDGYVSGLKAKASEKGVAIPEAKLAHVAQLFDAGMDEVARSFGDTLVANATATATDGEVIALGAGAPDPQIESDKVIADNLRAHGWKVEQDSKGRIVSKTPPQKAGR